MTAALIFKIMTPDQWHAFKTDGVFTGAPVDEADGFIHLSDADQVEETAAKHFHGAGDLVLVAVDPASLGEALKWEPSRGGALFPHLYASLALSTVRWRIDLPARTDGGHAFPEDWRTRPPVEADQ